MLLNSVGPTVCLVPSHLVIKQKQHEYKLGVLSFNVFVAFGSVFNLNVLSQYI